MADLVASAPNLTDFSVSVDATLCSLQTLAGGGIGQLPPLGWTEMKPTLPLDCRFGEPCSFMLELVIGGDYVPLRSIGADFEVHMSNYPAQLNDQIVGIGHLISNSSEHWSGTFNNDEAGRRRAQVQATEENAEELSEGREGGAEEIGAAIVGEVGHMDNHIESLNLTRTIIMDDNDDGTVQVTIPASWFSQSGRYDFRIFGTTNYCAVNCSLAENNCACPSGEDCMVKLPPGSCSGDSRCDCSAHTPQLLEFYDKSLWFINMHPIICHDPLARQLVGRRRHLSCAKANTDWCIRREGAHTCCRAGRG